MHSSVQWENIHIKSTQIQTVFIIHIEIVQGTWELTAELSFWKYILKLFHVNRTKHFKHIITESKYNMTKSWWLEHGNTATVEGSVPVSIEFILTAF